MVVHRFGMTHCKPLNIPSCIGKKSTTEDSRSVDQRVYQELVGSLLILATRTHPDISAAVNLLCSHSSGPKEKGMIAEKRILRYLCGTQQMALNLRKNNLPLVWYSDSDWAGDVVDRKSTSGTLIMLAGTSPYWKTAKQDCLALSSTEVEHIAMRESSKKLIRVRSLLKELDMDIIEPTAIYEDNHGATSWVTNGVRNARHVAVRRHFFKEKADRNTVAIKYCPTEGMTVGILTKPLLRVKFEKHRQESGLPAPTMLQARGRV